MIAAFLPPGARTLGEPGSLEIARAIIAFTRSGGYALVGKKHAASRKAAGDRRGERTIG
ncbi:hypothetical protein [Gloeobacter morelensis]|uniref:Uncharacterized protein n=1 Tax=Gloeobacter morelensis MG652769 TaxID=2781736 RepID=A0ABY3PNG5_9CYAN|nr:hypothetical protein [Gloeobacter morelensis]UFP95243.1 hypothetical protein ISF26_03045 [Gloeobacter morelensis MG652769]